jgi:Co/Zn/Cd efflux system component
MEITRDIVRMTVIVGGILVLSSYVWGVSKMDHPDQLWGGVSKSLQKITVPMMFLAAIGFLVFWWNSMYSLSLEEVKSLQYPWSTNDENGLQRLFVAFLLFLVPSMLWLESTRFHEQHAYSWTPFLVIGILALVAIGNVLLILLSYSAYQQQVPGGGLMLIGTILLAIQVIINDLIIWSYAYPWKGP